jgi:P pilus assembly chaperone PapD
MTGFTSTHVRMILVLSLVIAALLPATAGLAQSGTISADPATLDFGNSIEQIQTVSKTLKIRNDGNANLVVQELLITGANASEFWLLYTEWPFTLTPGQEQQVLISFAPTSTGPKNAALRITSNAQNAAVFQVSLSGNGLNLSSAGRVNASVAPSRTDPVSGTQFTVAINIDMSSANPPANILQLYEASLVWNSSVLQYLGYSWGNAPWRWPSSIDQSAVSSGRVTWFDYDFNGAGGLSTVIQFRFKAIGAPGSSTALDLGFSRMGARDVEKLLPILTTNDSTIQVGGNAGAPDIVISPTSHNFGSLAVGSSMSQVFVVRNRGTAPLNVTGMSLQGVHANQFAIESGGAPFTLAPGEERNVSIKYAPTSAGNKNATLVIFNNDPTESILRVQLSGSVGVPDITVTPMSLNFGNVVLGAYANRNLVVRNDGNAYLFLTLFSMENHQNQYGFDSGTLSVLAPGQSGTIQITFAPTSVGTKTATFVIRSNDPDEVGVSVALSGNGVVAQAANNDDSDETVDEIVDETAEMIHTVYLPTVTK